MTYRSTLVRPTGCGTMEDHLTVRVIIYYQVIKRELNIRLIMIYVSLKIETRLIDEWFASVMGECVI